MATAITADPILAEDERMVRAISVACFSTFCRGMESAGALSDPDTAIDRIMEAIKPVVLKTATEMRYWRAATAEIIADENRQ